MRWVAAAAVVLAWLVVGGVLGPFTGRLAEVQRNDSASFLPADAESTRVQDLQQELADEDVLPAVAVFEYEQPVSEAEVAEVAELTRTLADPGVYDDAGRVKDLVTRHGDAKDRAARLLDAWEEAQLALEEAESQVEVELATDLET